MIAALTKLEIIVGATAGFIALLSLAAFVIVVAGGCAFIDWLFRNHKGGGR